MKVSDVVRAEFLIREVKSTEEALRKIKEAVGLPSKLVYQQDTVFLPKSTAFRPVILEALYGYKEKCLDELYDLGVVKEESNG